MSITGLRQDPLKISGRNSIDFNRLYIRLYLKNLQGEIWAPPKGNLKALVDFRETRIAPTAVHGQTKYSSCLLACVLKSGSGE